MCLKGDNMAATLLGNTIIVKLSNTESGRGSIFKWADLNKTKTCDTSSTASYFLTTNVNDAKEMKTFLDVDHCQFILDEVKTKEYINKVLEVVPKYFQRSEFHGDLDGSFDTYKHFGHSFLELSEVGFTIENNNSHRAYMRFENGNDNVKMLRNVVIAIFSNLVISKNENNDNVVYPSLKLDFVDKYWASNADLIKEEFIDWMENSDPDINSHDSIDGYNGALSKISEYANAKHYIFGSLYNCTDLKLLKDLDNTLFNSSKEVEYANYYKKGNRKYSSALRKYIKFIESRTRVGNAVNDVYTKKTFLDDVYIEEEKYELLVDLIREKKNVIIQGAPGVGKTFAAKRLAYSMIGQIKEDRIAFIQFHQNTSYENFVEGYKPNEETFVLEDGVFKSFVNKVICDENKENEYFLIIDEINRANLSKVFGELLMLIENDKREEYSSLLAYSKTKFTVPKNLYIIGLMNTADRSLALIDYALRRRFSFVEFLPAFDNAGFKSYIQSLGNQKMTTLIETVKEINKDIVNDKSLGRGFEIGHSYFCQKDNTTCTDEWINRVIKTDIIPILNEYWFDNEQLLKSNIEKLESIIR